MAIILRIIYGCFHATIAEINSYDRDPGCKVENIYCLALYRRCLLIPALEVILMAGQYFQKQRSNNILDWHSVQTGSSLRLPIVNMTFEDSNHLDVLHH